MEDYIFKYDYFKECILVVVEKVEKERVCLECVFRRVRICP